MTAHADAHNADLRWYHSTLDRDWMRLAACRGENPDMWFPNQRDRARSTRTLIRRERNKALTICVNCPVVDTCLAYAIAVDARFGIWGGLEERDRARITGKCLRR